MAKVLNPLHSSEARGRVQGLQFNTWRGTRFVKTNTSPCQPRSARQLTIRSRTAYLTRYWQSLTALNRGYWNAYAVSHPAIDWTGSPKRLTGLNWFVRCNSRLLDIGESIIEAPPEAAAPEAPTTFAATGAAGGITINWDAMAGTDLQIDIWLCGPHSAGVQGKIERATHVAYDVGETPPQNITDLFPGTYTAFGRTIDETTGLTSPWVSASDAVT
jgi:hypothetical protein